MNATEFALKLIQNYNAENNKYRRASRAVIRILGDQRWLIAARTASISAYYFESEELSKNRRFALNTFRSNSVPMVATNSIFVSFGVKNAALRSLNRELKQLNSGDEQYRTLYTIRRIEELALEIKEIKKIPVDVELGKMWRKQVNAVFDKKEAYESRWEARCAIVAFNKMNLGLQIKFGNCRQGGGSMSYINHVEVDGFKMKLSKFLDNAVFESAILNS